MAKEITSTLKGLYPDHTFPSAEVVPDSLILQIATVTSAPEGDVPVVRVPYVENDPTVGFVNEGEEIPTANPKLNEVLIQTKKLAIISEQSREASSYEESALAISTSLQRAITMKADHAFLNSEADPTGLWNLAGVIDAGTVTDSFDPFTDAIMGIEANMGKATAIVIDPASWGALSKLKYTSGVLQLGSPAEQASRTLFGLPVYVTPSMEAGHALVVSREDLIAAVGQIGLNISTEAAFRADSIVYRAIWRIGWNVVHPDRMAKVTITLPAGKANAKA